MGFAVAAAVSAFAGAVIELTPLLREPRGQALQAIHATFAWKLTHFEVNYFDFGFVKRGTVGCVLWLLPKGSHILAAVLLCVAALVALGFLIERFLWGLPRREQWCARLLVLLSPLGFQNLGFDFLRYDVFCLLVLALSLSCIRRRVLWPITILAPLGVLTHEAFLVYAVPIVMAHLVRLTRRGGVGSLRSWCWSDDTGASITRRQGLLATRAPTFGWAFAILSLPLGVVGDVHYFPYVAAALEHMS